MISSEKAPDYLARSNYRYSKWGYLGRCFFTSQGLFCCLTVLALNKNIPRALVGWNKVGAKVKHLKQLQRVQYKPRFSHKGSSEGVGLRIWNRGRLLVQRKLLFQRKNGYRISHQLMDMILVDISQASLSVDLAEPSHKPCLDDRVRLRFGLKAWTWKPKFTNFKAWTLYTWYTKHHRI